MPQWLVIGISGVTCGGKTTLAHGLRDYFKGLRNAPLWNTPYTIGDVQLISQDDYFLPVDDRRHKRVEKLNAINFELITSLNTKQMLADIAHIINGQTEHNYANFEHYALQYQQQQQQQQQLQQQQQQQHQQYNTNYYGKQHLPAAYQYQRQQHQQHHHQQHRQHHPQQQQQQHADHIMRLNINAQIAAQLRDKKINVLLIEGFMIFNQPEVLALCNLKYHFHLPYEKCYERRIKRTYDPPDVTGYFELCVWPYYEKNFAEYRECKDITVLNGEIAKEKIFKFVLQRIVHYFEERCDPPPPATLPPPVVACPPQQKRFDCMLYMGTVASNNNHLPTACPMEQ
ncbi:SWI/SNF chromatin-remodeling complex subunit SNF5 [Drosophila grimshawi]|uniref:GH15952 n=1 Tax=Drosophila grimshawi TaxID=7222 RepID=B4J1W4_DROGR|nr:SWI/SNF chromatin-remodeling complex subunit SNF5 [Drosophila grimshawi]EDV95889.1 GH15952 [Drosophila grimshawi]